MFDEYAATNMDILTMAQTNEISSAVTPTSDYDGCI